MINSEPKKFYFPPVIFQRRVKKVDLAVFNDRMNRQYSREKSCHPQSLLQINPLRLGILEKSYIDSKNIYHLIFQVEF